MKKYFSSFLEQSMEKNQQFFFLCTHVDFINKCTFSILFPSLRFLWVKRAYVCRSDCNNKIIRLYILTRFNSFCLFFSSRSVAGRLHSIFSLLIISLLNYLWPTGTGSTKRFKYTNSNFTKMHHIRLE